MEVLSQGKNINQKKKKDNGKVAPQRFGRHRGGVEVQRHSFSTFALDGRECSVSRSGCFTLQRETPGPIAVEAAWASKPIWTVWRRENFIAPTGNRVSDRQARSWSLNRLRCPCNRVNYLYTQSEAWVAGSCLLIQLLSFLLLILRRFQHI